MRYNNILDLLTSLGETKEEVIQKMVELGVKGNRGECKSCPIACFLAMEGWYVSVGVEQYGKVDEGLTIGFDWFPLNKFPQLQPIREFIRAFDSGELPHLEINHFNLNPL